MDGQEQFLGELSDALARGMDLKEALGRILQHLRAQSGTIHWLDDGVLRLAAHGPGMPPVVLEKIQTIPIGKGMAGLAVERREPVSTCNLQTDTSGDVRPGARGTGLAGSICVPIWHGEDPVGTLGVGNQGERTFTEEETSLLLEIGRTLAAHMAR